MYLATIHLKNLQLREFKSFLAFYFRLDRSEYEREINYTYLCIVSKYDVLHPAWMGDTLREVCSTAARSKNC